jgi:hypothetical protein
MAAKKKSATKKRTASKHVLKAREGKPDAEQSDQNPQQGTDTAGVGGEQQNPSKTAASKSGKNRHVKDPQEVASYLTDWQNHKNGQGTWKFNKNTQSWLIRHLYELEKVSKGTFTILLDYFAGLEGNTMKSRIRAEASRRALRYKEHTKKEPTDKETESKSESNTTPQSTSKQGKKAVVNSATVQEQLEEEERWQKLDENEKRKEYKRARQILDIIKE